MKINFLIGGLSGGGAERVICNIANYAVKSNWQVTIITMADDKPSYPLSNKVNRTILLYNHERGGFVHNSYLRIRRLIKILKASSVDAYVVFLPTTIIISLLLKCFTKAKVIVSERNIPTSYSLFTRIMLKLICRKADAWVFQTEDALKFYGKNNLKSFCIIPNAVNPEFLCRKRTASHNNKIISIGRLNEQKNQSLLIKSFADLIKDYPSLQLVIFGEGPLREQLERQIEELGISNHVSLPGYSEDIVHELESCYMFVLSSNWEGIPNSLLEAMCVGVPCIATDCDGGGAKLLIENYHNGILIPKNNKEVLTESIKQLISNDDLYHLLSDNALKVNKEYNPNAIYAKWLSFIENTIKK